MQWRERHTATEPAGHQHDDPRMIQDTAISNDGTAALGHLILEDRQLTQEDHRHLHDMAVELQQEALRAIAESPLSADLEHTHRNTYAGITLQHLANADMQAIADAHAQHHTHGTPQNKAQSWAAFLARMGQHQAPYGHPDIQQMAETLYDYSSQPKAGPTPDSQ